LSVTAHTLQSISVTPVNASSAVGSSQQYAATGAYSDGTTANISSSVTWNSSNTGVAKISTTGVATNVAAGSANITATSGTINGSTGLTVNAVTLVSISVSPTQSSIAKGATLQFSATGAYSNGSTANLTNSVAWTATSTTVATISSSGLATGIASGSTSITAAVGAISASTTLAVTVSSPFPGISYDTWVDFEKCTTAAAPTVACLVSSTHGTAGSWDVSNMASLIKIQAAGADPGTADGNHATRGMAYNLANGNEGTIRWSPPSQLSSLSFGFWYKTGQPGAWVEGPHVITLYNNTFGNMLRLSDERSSGNNARQIRVSPLDVAVTGIADNTWYWLTMKWVQSGVGTFSVYNTSLQLVGTVNFTNPYNYPTQIIELGNTSGTAAESGTSAYFDDVILDYTNVQFPVLPRVQ